MPGRARVDELAGEVLPVTNEVTYWEVAEGQSRGVNDRTAGALRITAIDAAVEGAIRALPLLRHILCDLRVGLSKTGFTKSRGDRELLTHQIQAKGPLAGFRIFHHGHVAGPVGRFEQKDRKSVL